MKWRDPYQCQILILKLKSFTIRVFQSCQSTEEGGERGACKLDEENVEKRYDIIDMLFELTYHRPEA